jgi:DNA-binding transcriptional LysR family regulator
MLSSSWLEAFIVFAEQLNFTHAARLLHLSQPALHVQIARLGEEVGVPLYQRIGRRLELTAAGIEVLRFARESRERSAQIVEELRTGQSHRPVTLAAGTGAYLYLLGPALREFTRRCKARLELLVRDRAATIAAVRSGEAHLGVATIDGPLDGLEVKTLLRVEQVLVMPARHALCRKRRLQLCDLANQPLIVPPEGQPQRTTLAQALASAGVPWQVAIEATGWQLVLRFVELGMGLTVVNGCCELPRGLVARPLPELPRVSYCLVNRALGRAGPARRGDAALLRQILIDRVPAR